MGWVERSDILEKDFGWHYGSSDWQDRAFLGDYSARSLNWDVFCLL